MNVENNIRLNQLIILYFIQPLLYFFNNFLAFYNLKVNILVYILFSPIKL